MGPILGPFDIKYMPHTAQVLVDLVAKFTKCLGIVVVGEV